MREFDRLSEHESFTTTQVQLDHLSFFQNALSRSHEKFSEVREESGKSQGKDREKENRTKWLPCKIQGLI